MLKSRARICIRWYCMVYKNLVVFCSIQIYTADIYIYIVLTFDVVSFSSDVCACIELKHPKWMKFITFLKTSGYRLSIQRPFFWSLLRLCVLPFKKLGFWTNAVYLFMGIYAMFPFFKSQTLDWPAETKIKLKPFKKCQFGMTFRHTNSPNQAFLVILVHSDLYICDDRLKKNILINFQFLF